MRQPATPYPVCKKRIHPSGEQGSGATGGCQAPALRKRPHGNQRGKSHTEHLKHQDPTGAQIAKIKAAQEKRAIAEPVPITASQHERMPSSSIEASECETKQTVHQDGD